MKKKMGHVELEAAGFQVIATCGKFYFIACKGDNVFRFIRQGKHIWHCFWWDWHATGSGSDPAKAIDGGLGDVIETDAQLKRYEVLEHALPSKDSGSWVRI